MSPKDSRRALRAATGVDGLEERFAVVKGVRLRYFLGGAGGGGAGGDSLVLLHGLGGGASNWRALARLLLPRGGRLLVVELPGHGGSSPLPAMPSLAPVADRVALLAEREGLAPALYVGHSLGGLVAVRVAGRRPGAARGLVLASAAGISSTSRRAKSGLALTSLVKPGRRLAPFRRTIAARPRLRRAVLAWGVADPDGFPPSVAESFLVSPALNTDTVSAARALIREDVRRDLAMVRCPCLVLWGAKDRQTGVADAFDYARRLRATLRVLADCGHLLIGERPEACAEAIDSFVRGLELRPGSEAR